jgi:hypothetical protein
MGSHTPHTIYDDYKACDHHLIMSACSVVIQKMPLGNISLAQLGKGFEVLKALKRLVGPASTTLTTLAEVTSVGGGATSASASFHDEDGCQKEGNTGR